MSIKYSCSDFLEFQDALKKMRDLDDKVIYALNTTVPTESFRNNVHTESTCRNLYQELKIGHNQREDAIKNCILETANKVKKLKEERDINRDDVDLDKKFKTEQRKLRLLQSELNVEDIVKARSYKVFSERCRSFFKAGAS